jgi:hypothetical protein
MNKVALFPSPSALCAFMFEAWSVTAQSAGENIPIWYF